MRNEIAKERRESYEREIRGICDNCTQVVEKARHEYIKAKREARRIRDEAISKVKRDYAK